jgi:hypothetical protein
MINSISWGPGGSALQFYGTPRIQDGWEGFLNWAVEGTKDEVDWFEHDQREKDDSLKGGKVTGTFPISRGIEVDEVRLR